MKKIIFILASMLLLFASCKQNETDVIKSEFKQYVKENFDDPNNLKEIVSVELLSKTNKDSLSNYINKCDDILNDIIDKNKRMLTNISNSLNYSSTSDKLYLGQYVSLYMETREKIEYKAIPKSYEIKDALSKIDSTGSYSIYTVKFRVKKGNDLSLRTIYAIKYDNEKSEFNAAYRTEDFNHGYGDVHKAWRDQIYILSEIIANFTQIQEGFLCRDINVLQ